jgi:preprotein translocase SecE subunit
MKENALINYFKDSFSELNKVTWPTKNQAVRLTFIVLGFIFASALALGFFDFIFNFGYKYLIQLSPAKPIIQQDASVPADTALPIGGDNSGLKITDQNGNPIDTNSIKFDTTPTATDSAATPATTDTTAPTTK